MISLLGNLEVLVVYVLCKSEELPFEDTSQAHLKFRLSVLVRVVCLEVVLIFRVMRLACSPFIWNVLVVHHIHAVAAPLLLLHSLAFD